VPQPLISREFEPGSAWSVARHERLDWSQALAADAATIRENGATALARVPAQEAMLPHTADFRRLVLAFHKVSGNSAVSI
jgi:hypothetical protein